MKLLIKKLANTNLGILIRNSLNLKPVLTKITQSKYPITVSDAFAWRTDNGYKTVFKYSDILNLFFKTNDSWVELHIYSKKNELLKIEKFSNLSISNEFTITSKYLNNIKDYGVFYIYHFTREKLDNENIISNRCYIGFSKNENLYSFVHGNILAKYRQIYPNNKINTDVVKISMFQNHNYRIQKFFNDLDKNELFFSNPTSKIIKFSVENKNYKLNPGCAKIIETAEQIITIRSNCLFLRPTVFSYKDNYIDVHHA
jgi:hypothetical protein